MTEDIYIQENIIIPGSEIEITSSRAGGPGGQHVNKASTRITVRWNIKTTKALTEEQKMIVIENLRARLTVHGELIINSSSSRSQQSNKKNALTLLARLIRKALHVPKKRIKTITPQQAQEKRLKVKARHSMIKKMRSKKMGYYD